jgi:hypothetical protein
VVYFRDWVFERPPETSLGNAAFAGLCGSNANITSVHSMLALSHLYPAGTPSAFAVLAQFFWIIQIALIIHVLRTGRPYWWILILFIAPFIGGLAYVAVELMPGFHAPEGWWESIKPRRWRIAGLREQLEESETVTNRLKLADALFEAGEVKEAHTIASECLKGIFQNDPQTLVDVAKYKIGLGNYGDAYALLRKVDTTGNRLLGLQLQIMRGDCLTALQQFPEAEAAYESVLDRYIGEAPRAGLAIVYERIGRAAAAVTIWKEILKKFRRAGPAWRRTELRWYKLAKAKLGAKKS